MAKLKMNRRVPNKIADLLKKISLMGTEDSTGFFISIYEYVLLYTKSLISVTGKTNAKTASLHPYNLFG